MFVPPWWTRSRRSRVTVAHAKHLPCPRFCSEGRAGRHLAVVLLLPGRSRRRRSRGGGGGRTASTLPHTCVVGGPHKGRDLLVASSSTHPVRPDRLHALPPESPEHCLHDAQLTLSQLQASQACALQSMAVCITTLPAVAAGFGTPMCLVMLLLALLQGGQFVAGFRLSLLRSFCLSRLARLLCSSRPRKPDRRASVRDAFAFASLLLCQLYQLAEPAFITLAQPE